MAYSPQKLVYEEGRLLNEKGCLLVSGRAKRPVFEYSREDIPLYRQMRVKEWDSYVFGNDAYQVSVTISDLSYAGIVAVSLVDLKRGVEKSNSYRQLLPVGRYELPGGSGFGDIVFRSEHVSLNITVGKEERRLNLRYQSFDDVKELSISAVFMQPNEDSMAIAIPFKEDKNAFYYNHKINCMPVKATVRLAGETTEFNAESTFGCFNWGRGVWPKKNRWIWCSASGLHEGERFGLNLGEGFGDRSEAGENTFYYKGKAYCIGEIDITVPEDIKRGAWNFIGENGDINLRMVPEYHRFSEQTGYGAEYRQHQVFGKYYGTVMLRSEDGEVTRLVLDGITGFAEEVRNKW